MPHIHRIILISARYRDADLATRTLIDCIVV